MPLRELTPDPVSSRMSDENHGDGAMMPHCPPATDARSSRDEGCPSSDPACADPDNRHADTRTADTVAERLVIGRKLARPTKRSHVTSSTLVTVRDSRHARDPPY
jgi:hypothetical protein